MRLALAQLRKLKMPYSYEEELDLSEELNGFEDIVSSTNAKIKGTINTIDTLRYYVSMDIDITLKVKSAISLNELELPISTSCEEIYATEASDDEDVIKIEGATLDTFDAVLTQILCEKPMRSVLEGEEFESDEDDFSKEDINPAFMSLKDLLK